MADRSKVYENVLGVVFGLLLLARFHSPVWITVGILFTLAVMVSPWLAALVAKGWTALAHLIGGVVSRVLLACVFFLIITPVAVMRRVLRKDSLQLRTPGTTTMFLSRSHTFEAKDLEKPW